MGQLCGNRYQHSTGGISFNLRVKIGAEDTDEYDIVSVYGKGYLFTCR